MEILSIHVLDCKNKQWTSATHPKCHMNISLQIIAEKAEVRAQNISELNDHWYFKKNSEKVFLFICNEKIYSKGQVNLLFTKIKNTKNLELLRLELQNIAPLHFNFFQQKISLTQHKLQPMHREHGF